MSDNTLKIAQAPDYEFKTITADDIRTLDIKEITQQLSGFSSADFGSTDMSVIGGIDTIQLPSLSTTVSGTSFTYTGPNTWTTSGGPYISGGGTGGVYTISTPAPTVSIGQTGTIQLKGEKADIDINGKSLMKTLERIEERLNLLQTNTELEAEWDELRELGERYRALEQRCRDKAKTWETLKSMPPPQVD